MPKTEISYQDAVREIEETIRKIESGELNVDQLTDKVKRVSVLLEICRKKLKTAEEEIVKIIEEMKEDTSEDSD
jgi:exodeoxyribonuclease VII small subunit